MEVTAHLRNLRISPRKVRLAADVIRGMDVHNAKIQLEFLNKKSSQPILTLMNSAIANAKHNFSLSDENLYVSKIFVNEGATLKRWIPRAMGRASAIHKRTSHITIILDEIKSEKKKTDAKENKEESKNKTQINDKEIDKKEVTQENRTKAEDKNISSKNK
ncbi:50S ribosomal protein L22 [Candidatus Parcubacteria bacterium]|nr:50S ribosomal protein L22 [Candidatus Parcubacteria bacterium]